MQQWHINARSDIFAYRPYFQASFSYLDKSTLHSSIHELISVVISGCILQAQIDWHGTLTLFCLLLQILYY